MIGDDADADAFDARDRQRLDVAAEHLDIGLACAYDVRLDLLVAAPHRRGPTRKLQQVATHAASVSGAPSRTAIHDGPRPAPPACAWLSCGGAADGHLAHPQRRLSRRHRHALPALAAGAGPRVE